MILIYYLTDFSRITPDGLLYMNYRKEKYGTSSNPDIVELCWKKDTVFLDNMNDIDEKFNNYCNKINPIIEEIKIKKEKQDKKNERSRKLEIIKSILVIIGSILAFLFILYMNYYEFNAHDDFGYEFVTFILSCIFIPYVWFFFIASISDLKTAIKSKKNNKS